MKLKEIILKLTGDINPVGCGSRDPGRLENLKTLCSLVEELVDEIEFVSRNKISYEGSVKICGDYADKFLKALRENL